MKLTTKTIAQQTNYSVEQIRYLETRGVIRAERDSLNRRLFDASVIPILKARRKKRK